MENIGRARAYLGRIEAGGIDGRQREYAGIEAVAHEKANVGAGVAESVGGFILGATE